MGLNLVTNQEIRRSCRDWDHIHKRTCSLSRTIYDIWGDVWFDYGRRSRVGQNRYVLPPLGQSLIASFPHFRVFPRKVIEELLSTVDTQQTERYEAYRRRKA